MAESRALRLFDDVLLPATHRHRSVMRTSCILFAFVAAFAAGGVSASQFNLPTPPGSGKFGTAVAVLDNGNIVVADPAWESDRGAVYLFNQSGAELGKLEGAKQGDRLGSGGILPLTSGGFLVFSPLWANDSALEAGAVTHGNSDWGWLPGTVISESNSLVGTQEADHVGSGSFIESSSGSVVICSPDWDRAATVDAGAASFVPPGKTVSGSIDSSNALVGASAHDEVCSGGAFALSNGNYVISSPLWNNAGKTKAGAATWGSGTLGVSGEPTPENSLVGAWSADRVGLMPYTDRGGIFPLDNGNYVVCSPYLASSRGSATWVDGAAGLPLGNVTDANSLVGTVTTQVCFGGVFALRSGNFVVSSPKWKNAQGTLSGATTWGDGNGGMAGYLSESNSLVGVGSGLDQRPSVFPLTNGHYVIASPFWSNGAETGAGAVTWADGFKPTVGGIDSSNSIHGSLQNAYVGFGGVTALRNGNYVIRSPKYSSAITSLIGAVTWADGSMPSAFAVSPSNSWVGKSPEDHIGNRDVLGLDDGSYVIASSLWDNDATSDTGAVTWLPGAASSNGVVNADNSLTGTHPGDQIGYVVAATAGGRYVIASPYTQNAAGVVDGAVTLTEGGTLAGKQVGPENSLVGTGITSISPVAAVSPTRIVVRSDLWSNDPMLPLLGAVTLADSTADGLEAMSPKNTVFGTSEGGGSTHVVAFAPDSGALVVGRPDDNVVTILRGHISFHDGFEERH